jgi:hypothetical protein
MLRSRSVRTLPTHAHAQKEREREGESSQAEGLPERAEKDFKEGAEKYDRQARGEPSMLSGHAQYVKGAVEQTLGSMIGSEAMKKAGSEAKEAGVTEMKAAYHGQDDWMPPGLEKKIGKVIGCEGMAEIGEEKLRQKHDK